MYVRVYGAVHEWRRPQTDSEPVNFCWKTVGLFGLIDGYLFFGMLIISGGFLVMNFDPYLFPNGAKESPTGLMPVHNYSCNHYGVHLGKLTLKHQEALGFTF